MTFHIITMSTYGTGLSGGDRIWIELAKRLRKKYPTFIYLWEEALQIAKREGLKEVSFVLWSAKFWAYLGFFLNYIARIFIGIFRALSLNVKNDSETIIYSASEFWQDSLPAFILKLRFPKVKWVAAWYQTAPNPFKVKYHLRAFLYFLMQLPIKPIISKYADLVIVNNEDEKRQFPAMAQKDKIFVMLGAVDLAAIGAYRDQHRNIPKIYDAVFQGRFHPQKGVLELVDIWKIVTTSAPKAVLTMIGDGPLMQSVKLKIKNEKLEKNIKLFGYLFDGPQKYKIFSQSKIALHPSVYDSGGMAAAEAMAFNLPAVGFDLVSYRSYYPKGMVKAKVGNLNDFAQKVLSLLESRQSRTDLGQEALRMLESNWSWDRRVEALLSYLD